MFCDMAPGSYAPTAPCAFAKLHALASLYTPVCACNKVGAGGAHLQHNLAVVHRIPGQQRRLQGCFQLWCLPKGVHSLPIAMRLQGLPSTWAFTYHAEHVFLLFLDQATHTATCLLPMYASR